MPYTLINPIKHCKGCWLYEERYNNAEKIDFMFDSDTTWDFETCLVGCIRKTRYNEKEKARCKAYQHKHAEQYREYSRQYYYRNKNKWG